MMVTTSAFAGHHDSHWTEADSYAEKTKQKLDYGMKNLLGGWTNIFCRCEKEKNSENYCPIRGFLKGSVKAVVSTVGGALHTATFPIPVDFPIPCKKSKVYSH